MIIRCLTIAATALGLALAPASRAAADAGDFIGGAIVGGLVGAAIQKDRQNKRVTTTRTVRPQIAVTQHGQQTQTALNYFGYNAGVVDGQIGRGTRGAIQRYQASMGYPVNGYDFQPYQYDFLMQAYYWAINGGQAQTQLVGQPLLMAYRQQMQTGSALAAAPATSPPSDTTTASGATDSLPNLFAGTSPSISLANRCNAVMLQTSTNGGYTTLASMSDPEFTLSEQFCLARSYAMARGEDLMQSIAGLTPQQITDQCSAFGALLGAQVDALSLNNQPDVEAEMRDFALGTGIPPADLAATSRVCLAVGYRQDDMEMAVGSALLLVALGEPAYGELLGHHLREGFGTNARRDLAAQWYMASLNALDGGAEAVFMPGQADRPQLLRAAAMQIAPGERQGNAGASAPTVLPTFTVAE